MNIRENKARPPRPWERLPRGFWRGFISGAFALLVIGGLLAFFLSPELLKHRSPFPLEAGLGQSRIIAAIDGSYNDKTNPTAATPQNLTAGKTIYNANCAFCHGVSGQGDADIGKNMFPPAANLRQQATLNKTDGQLFWIVENGLAFVGMPAFKSTLSQDDLWKVILYIRQLQKGPAASTDSGQSTAAAANPAATQTMVVAATATAAAPPTAAATTTTSKTTAASGTTAATGDAAALARGMVLFQQEGCVACHGGDKATGGLGPALNNITFPFSGLLRQVRSGSGIMPPFPANQLSDNDAMLIYNYLKSLQK